MICTYFEQKGLLASIRDDNFIAVRDLDLPESTLNDAEMKY